MNKLIVAIWMVTYNHEKFIDKALQGIINQQTDFDYKVFIGEDCSSDKTEEICLNYQKKYPEKVELITRNINVGNVVNALDIYKICFESKAKYIAMCEGDDYWTDPYKLQKQVDILEANPSYSICFHKVLYNHLDNPKSNYNSASHKTITTLEDLASFNYKHSFNYLDEGLTPLYNYIPTASCVFRHNVDKLPDWFLNLPIGDYPLHLINAQYGDIYFIDEVMATYNIHSSGIWTTKSDEYRHTNYLIFLIALIDKFDVKINTILLNNILFLLFFLSKEDKDIYEKLVELVSKNEKLINELLTVKVNQNIKSEYKTDLLFSEIKTNELSKRIQHLQQLNFLAENSFEYKVGTILLKPFRKLHSLKQKLKIRTRLKRFLKG